MKTKAAILYETVKPLVIEEIDIPELRRGEALVKISYAGVCHSQLNEVRGFKGEDRYLPHLIGHEGSGYVEAVGEGVTKVTPGDYVVLSWIKGKGLDTTGIKYSNRGIPINAGQVAIFTERAIVAENRLVPLSTKIPPDIAALLGCAVPTGAGMVFNLLSDSPNSSIVIYGLGGIGTSALLAAKVRGYKPIIAVDVHDHKLSLATELGADYAVNSEITHPLDKILKLTDGRGANFAIESSGVPKVMELVLPSLGYKGIGVIAGNAKKGATINIDPAQLNMGKKLLGTWGGDTDPDRDIPRYVDLYQRKMFPLEKLLTRSYSLEQVNEALSDLEEGRLCRSVIKM